MPTLLLPNSILSMPSEAADRLLTSGNGDAALLYLGLLRHGQVEKARKTLEWSDHRTSVAFTELVKLGLAEGDAKAVAVPEERDQPPTYQRNDLIVALREDDTFRGLYQAMEKSLGKTFSDMDLNLLYTIYDYLELPAEVIYLLTAWCTEQCERKYGPGHVPRMPMIKREAFRWKRMGADTLPAAEEYLSHQQVLINRESEILPLLNIQGRAPVDREHQYISGWVDMGFDNDTIRLAYERTLFQKGSMNWAYMNSILKRWHAAGLHTVEQVETKDKPAPRPGRVAVAPAPKQNYQPSRERIQKSSEWLDEFLANQNGKER